MDHSGSGLEAVIAEATAFLERGDFAGGMARIEAARRAHPADAGLALLAATVLGAEGRFGEGVAALADHAGDAKAAALADAFRGFRDYQAAVDAQRGTPYMDYPPLVHIETFAQCNADCVFCPYGTLERKGVRMADDLIAKIVDDLTAIPADLPFTIAPQKVNEPFLDVRIFDVFALIAEKLPNARLSINSNGAALTDRIIARLGEVPNVGRLWVSVNDHRPEVYESVMRLPFARTAERLDALHAAKERGAIPFPVQLGKVCDHTPADEAFAAWVSSRYPRFEPGLLMRGNWVGQTDIVTDRPVAVGCQRWFDLSIAATGAVALCCMDGRVEHPIGDITTTHALEIYNAPAYRALRESTRTRLEAGAPCDSCNFL